MQAIGWHAEPANPLQADQGRTVPRALERVARGDVVLTEALLMLAQQQDEQVRSAADLLEREIWALTAILELCAPIWRDLPQPTLRFAPDRPDGPHLELSLISHLATCAGSRAGDQAAVAAVTPRWTQGLLVPNAAASRADRGGRAHLRTDLDCRGRRHAGVR